MGKTAPKPEPTPETALNPESELLRARSRAQSIVQEIRGAWREPDRITGLLAEALALPERIGFFVGVCEVERQLSAAHEAEELEQKAADLDRRAVEAEGKVSQIRDSIDREVEQGRVTILRNQANQTRRLADVKRKSCEWLGQSDTARSISDIEAHKTRLLARQKLQADAAYRPERDPDFVENIPGQLEAADLEIQRLREKAERRGTPPDIADASTWGARTRGLADNAAVGARFKLFGELWGNVPATHAEIANDD